ncbi:hypothetical protein [Cupriavidus sp. IDO]|uniref:hypothetical protein n=1 Tax=Cupriavidus sp. IDO TaxID=1539142 RepID=UPI000B085584|nr:hypothetical protein [Cupriavidus sp. IDO]
MLGESSRPSDTTGAGQTFASPNIITAPVTQIDLSTHTMLSKVGGIAGAAQL